MSKSKDGIHKKANNISKHQRTQTMLEWISWMRTGQPKITAIK